MKPITLDTIRAERAAPRTVTEIRQAFQEGRTPAPLLAVRLWTTWATGPYPLALAPADEWATWFRLVGYLHNGIRYGAMRPGEPRRLYRGAAPGSERGMSWTRFPRLAAQYAARVGGRVYEIDADPSWVLARQTPGIVPEHGDEWVVALPDGVAPALRSSDTEEAPGMRTWGRYGAAGLLVHDEGRVLLQLRSALVQNGRTWSIPGGARHSGEHVVDAAVREAEEECGLGFDDIDIIGAHVAEPVPAWRYTTVVAILRPSSRSRPLTASTGWEVDRHEWVAIGDVDLRRLHPGFAAAWPSLRSIVERRLTLYT